MKTPEDVQRTLTRITAISISDAINKYCSGAMKYLYVVEVQKIFL